MKEGKQFDSRLLVAILNSSLLNNYYNKKLITNADVFPYIKGIHLKQFPIPVGNSYIQQLIIERVSQIINHKKQSSSLDTTILESEVNVLVYHLYGLTYDEICIIDPEAAITRDEYEKYTKCFVV